MGRGEGPQREDLASFGFKYFCYSPQVDRLLSEPFAFLHILLQHKSRHENSLPYSSHNYMYDDIDKVDQLQECRKLYPMRCFQIAIDLLSISDPRLLTDVEIC